MRERARRTLTLLRPGGVRLTLDASWVLLAGLLYWTLDAVVMPFLTPEIDRQGYRLMALAGVVGILVLVAIRELAVASVAARLRLPLAEIRLLPMGGVLRGPPGGAAFRQELLLLVVGAAASALLCLALLVTVFKMSGPETPLVLSGTGFFLGIACVAHLAFGLLPISPFAGGRAVGAALARWATTEASAARIVRSIDLLLGAASIAAGLWLVMGPGEAHHLGIWLIVAAALILIHGRSWRAVRQSQ